MSSVTSEEFLWSCELSAANKDYAWAPEVTWDPEDDTKPVHK